MRSPRTRLARDDGHPGDAYWAPSRVPANDTPHWGRSRFAKRYGWQPFGPRLRGDFRLVARTWFHRPKLSFFRAGPAYSSPSTPVARHDSTWRDPCDGSASVNSAITRSGTGTLWTIHYDCRRQVVFMCLMPKKIPTAIAKTAMSVTQTDRSRLIEPCMRANSASAIVPRAKNAPTMMNPMALHSFRSSYRARCSGVEVL